MPLGLVGPEGMRGCAGQIWQALTVGFQIMLGTSIITHILCRWFGPIREGGWGWAAAKQSLDLGPVGAGEGAGGDTGKAVNKVASEAVGKAVGERVDGRPGGWGVGRAACEGAQGGTSMMALRMVDPAWMWGYAIQPWQDLMAGSRTMHLQKAADAAD